MSLSIKWPISLNTWFTIPLLTIRQQTNSYSTRRLHKQKSIKKPLNRHADGTASCDKLSLWTRLWLPATVVTMEEKYAVCPCVAEFWCSITSIAFASPALVYLFMPLQAIPWQVHVCCIFGVLSALASTIYHCTLFKLFSSLDAAIACTTMHVFMLLVLSTSYSHLSWMHNYGFWLLNVVSVLVYILHRWENTAKPAVQVIAISAFLFSVGLVQLGAWNALFAGWSGITCFLLDRKHVMPVHSIWHIGGGLSLGLATYSVMQHQLIES
ncbi:hypothetical protein BDF22DRAFT_683320 [Syncephalis plumigaleata]|nr:hypothetical protein BDF22DRAFT_683320 [Syncephalis plumigaleata]